MVAKTSSFSLAYARRALVVPGPPQHIFMIVVLCIPRRERKKRKSMKFNLNSRAQFKYCVCAHMVCDNLCTPLIIGTFGG